MTPCVESKFPWTYGLFGGYGAPTYPLGKVKGINAFDSLVELPEGKLEGAAPPKCVLYGAIPAEISPEAIVEAGRALRGWFGSSRG